MSAIIELLSWLGGNVARAGSMLGPVAAAIFRVGLWPIKFVLSTSIMSLFFYVVGKSSFSWLQEKVVPAIADMIIPPSFTEKVQESITVVLPVLGWLNAWVPVVEFLDVLFLYLSFEAGLWCVSTVLRRVTGFSTAGMTDAIRGATPPVN